jgi:hypothetical protein
VKRAACNIFDKLIWIEEEDGFFGMRLSLRDFGHDVGDVCQLSSFLFGLFEFLLIFGGLYKEIGFGIFDTIGEQGINKRRFFTVFVSGNAELSLEIEAKAINFTFRILNKRVIRSAYNLNNFHFLKTTELSWPVNMITFEGELPVEIGAIAEALVFIWVN